MPEALGKSLFPDICGAELRCPLVPTFGGRGKGRERLLLSCKMESTKTVVSSQAALVEMNYFVCFKLIEKSKEFKEPL